MKLIPIEKKTLLYARYKSLCKNKYYEVKDSNMTMNSLSMQAIVWDIEYEMSTVWVLNMNIIIVASDEIITILK